MAILLAGLTIVPSQLLLVGLLFIFANIFLQVLQPLINAMSFYYIRHGMKIDFGLARGTGSLAFCDSFKYFRIFIIKICELGHSI